MSSLAELIVAHYAEPNAFDVCLPIDKVCGIDCCVRIHRFINNPLNRHHYTLRIDADFLYNEEDCDNINLYGCDVLGLTNKQMDIDSANELLNNCKETLKKLKFNKFSGSFTTTNGLGLLFYDFLKDVETIELGCDDCCVCLEKTSTQTECGHSLCLLCWSNIKKVECEDSDCLWKKCPICREILHRRLEDNGN